MKNIYIVIVCFVAFGCATNKMLYTTQESVELGFTRSYILQKPTKKNRARIYFVRDGLSRMYNADTIYYLYNPNITDTISFSKNDAQGNFGKLGSNARFFVDVEADKVLAIFAGVESKTYLIFTPKSGYIYCIEGETRTGWWVARSSLKFIDKERCEELIVADRQKRILW